MYAIKSLFYIYRSHIWSELRVQSVRYLIVCLLNFSSHLGKLLCKQKKSFRKFLKQISLDFVEQDFCAAKFRVFDLLSTIKSITYATLVKILIILQFPKMFCHKKLSMFFPPKNLG